jgi:hypothetical protein
LVFSHFVSLKDPCGIAGACAPVDLTLKNLAMNATLYHQGDKAKGFSDGSKFYA